MGAVRLGALNLHSDQPTALTDDQHADALVMADIASQAVLAAGGRAAREAGSAGDGCQLPIRGAPGPGIVAAQLDVGVGQALIRLKAYAFGNGRPLTEVAEDVVARTLRFDARGGGSGPAS